MAALTHVVVRPSAVQLWITADVDGRRVPRRINDFPGTGAFISIDKLSGHADLVEGQKGCAALTGSEGRGYRMVVTVVAFSPADRFLFRVVRRSLSVSMTANTMTYASGSARIQTEPTRGLSSDSLPTMAWPLVGSFPIVRPGVYVPPPIASSALINATTAPLGSL